MTSQTLISFISAIIDNNSSKKTLYTITQKFAADNNHPRKKKLIKFRLRQFPRSRETSQGLSGEIPCSFNSVVLCPRALPLNPSFSFSRLVILTCSESIKLKVVKIFVCLNSRLSRVCRSERRPD